MLSPNIKSSVYTVEGNPQGGFPSDQFLPINLTYKAKDSEPVLIPLFNPGSPAAEGISFKHTGKVWQMTCKIPDCNLPIDVSVEFATNSGENKSVFNLPKCAQSKIVSYKINTLSPSKTKKKEDQIDHIELSILTKKLAGFENLVPQVVGARRISVHQEEVIKEQPKEPEKPVELDVDSEMTEEKPEEKAAGEDEEMKEEKPEAPEEPAAPEFKTVRTEIVLVVALAQAIKSTDNLSVEAIADLKKEEIEMQVMDNSV